MGVYIWRRELTEIQSTMGFSSRSIKTPESWFQDHLRKAANLDITKTIKIMQQDPREAAQYLLLPIDGFRALIAQCLVLNGVQVQLSDEPPGPTTLIPQPKNPTNNSHAS